MINSYDSNLQQFSICQVFFAILFLTLSLKPVEAKIALFEQDTFSTRKDTVEVESEENLEEVIARNEALLEKYPKDVFIPNVLFQLSELYVKKARLEYKRRILEYEQDLKKLDQGLIKTEPILPRISLKKAIELCYQILEKFPEVHFKDQVLYRLAICHQDEGNREKAEEFFRRLIYELPESPYVPEAYFRIGEYYFNKRDFHKAISHYSQLLTKWDNPYFNMALYKLGWSYYNINDFPNAISTFIYLLSDIRLLEEADTKVLGKTKADLRKEAIDYVAICFSEFGGPQKAKVFLTQKGNESYNILVFLKMGEIYQKRNFYSEAIETYQTLLELYPFYQYAPRIQKLIVECYENDLNVDKAIQAREVLVEKYGPGSKWLNQYPEGQVRKDALKQAEESLYAVGTYYQKKAQEKGRAREYLLAIEKYDAFLKKFPRAENAAKVNYYLAECYYEIKNFEAAAEEYSKVMTDYGKNEFQEPAAYNRILAYYNLLQENPQPDTLIFYLENFFARTEAYPIPIKVAHKAQKELIRACNDFVILLPQSDKIQEVLMKYGEILYKLTQYDLALKVYQKLVSDFKTGPYYASAYAMVAQCFFNLGKFDEAITTAEEVIRTFPDSIKLVEKAEKIMASSGFKKAESLRKQEFPLKAAGEFVKVAFNTSDAEIARMAAFEASAQYDSCGDSEKAVLVLEKLVEKNPDFKFADELLYKAGLLREKLNQWELAANNYLTIVDKYPGSTFAQKALFTAGACYENLKNWDRALSIYDRYITTFTRDESDDLLEAHYKVGEMAYNKADFNAALRGFERTVQKYENLKLNNKEVDEYIPARAQFMVGEIYFDRYQSIKLIPPLEYNLRRKREQFNIVLKAYTSAAKYNVADWTTAASCKIGITCEEFGKALRETPAPPDLGKEELEVYYAKLVNPFKEKALEAYKANVMQAEKNNIQNQWIEESKKRMEALIIELGLSTKPAFGDSESALIRKSTSN